MNKLLSRKQLSEHLGLDYRTITNWLVQGRLPHTRIGKVVRFSEDDIKEIVSHYHVDSTIK